MTMTKSNDVLNRAQSLGSAIADASDEIERTRRIPATQFANIHDARLCRMLLPQVFDGDEIEPEF